MYLSKHPVSKGELNIELGHGHDNDDDIHKIYKVLKRHAGSWKTGRIFNENVVKNHDGKAAPYGSGYEKVDEKFDKNVHLKLLNKALRAVPGSQKQKEIIRKLNVVRKAGGMRPLKETALSEVGIFPIQNYIKGIIPPNRLTVMNDRDKERVKSLVKDLVFTLNDFLQNINKHLNKIKLPLNKSIKKIYILPKSLKTNIKSINNNKTRQIIEELRTNKLLDFKKSKIEQIYITNQLKTL